MNENMKRWLCTGCGSMLGFIEEGILRIKRKDLIIQVDGGRVTENCYKCGKANIIEASKLQGNVVPLRES